MRDPLAGKPVPRDRLANIPTLISAYYTLSPDSSIKTERISFGTSGHRGSALNKSFNAAHVLAMMQAVCDYRKEKGYTGPLYMGMDTHALSTPAQMTAVSVCAANGVYVHIAKDGEYTPTPLVSFAILAHNAGAVDSADGIIMTPSHNPPEDGGFKYNPPDGGPADTGTTASIEKYANAILEKGLHNVRSMSYEDALKSDFVKAYDFITPYVEALKDIIDIKAIQKANLRLAADPLGGAAIGVYKKIKEIYGLNMEIVNPYVDPTFSFMTLDYDGKIRMDCSSPDAMASLINLREQYDLAFANDTDSDRHGIVTPIGGLMNPNHYLSVAIWYLFKHRNHWSENLKVGKTLVSSSMIDHVARRLGKEIYEVPVGFKWFSRGLFEEWLGFGGEESAGASFLRFDGRVWTTDKDGIIMNLLSAEIKSKTGRDPAEIYSDFEKAFGKAYYARLDAPATLDQKTKLRQIKPEAISINDLAGEPILTTCTTAPGNAASIGGIKIVTKHAWVAMRPSGTENIYKIYAESFLSPQHLAAIQSSAQRITTGLIST